MSVLSSRAKAIKPAATLALVTKARALRKEGRAIINFAAGEPDFGSPTPVLEGARAAMKRGETHYTPVAGTASFRQAIADDHERISGDRRSPEEVIVGCGAKHVLYNLIQTLIEPGEKVAYASPYWVSYPAMTGLAGGVPVPIHTSAEDGFRLDPERILRVIDVHAPKLIIINSPQNPTGVVYKPEDIDAIIQACVDSETLLISDEIYGDMVFGETPFHSALSNSDEAKRRFVIVVNGVSKNLAMTGWRIGWGIGPLEIIDGCKRIQSHSTSGVCSIAQAAALEGLRRGRPDVERMRKVFAKRRKVMLQAMNDMDGFELCAPGGAFYVFPNVSRFTQGSIGGVEIKDDLNLADLLLDRAGIAAVPGSAFGAPGHLRFSYALPEDEILDGLERVARCLKEWKAP